MPSTDPADVPRLMYCDRLCDPHRELICSLRAQGLGYRRISWKLAEVGLVVSHESVRKFVLRPETIVKTLKVRAPRLPKPEKAVEAGRAIEALEKPKAAERQKAREFGRLAEALAVLARKRQNAGRPKSGSKEVPKNFTEVRGEAKNQAAEHVGMSPRTYDKAKTVVEAVKVAPVWPPLPICTCGGRNRMLWTRLAGVRRRLRVYRCVVRGCTVGIVRDVVRPDDETTASQNYADV